MPSFDGVWALRSEIFPHIRSWWRSFLTTSPPSEPTEAGKELKVVLMFSLTGLALCLYLLEQIPVVSRGLMGAWGMLS